MPRSPRWLDRLPLGPVTSRALAEAAADDALERRAARSPLARLVVSFRTGAAMFRIVLAAMTFLGEGEHPMRHLGQDLRHAVRRLRQAPGFSAFAILTLAIGIGATTAIYSVMHATLHAPLAVADPARVINIYGNSFLTYRSAGRYQLSWPDLDDIRTQQTVFTDILAWARMRGVWSTDVQAISGFGEMVTGNYFALLGVPALHGRTLVEADDRPGAPPVVVLSHDTWRRHFNADPAVVGRTMTINDTRFEIAGVAAPDFRGVDMPSVMTATGWITFSAARELGLAREPLSGNERDNAWIFAKGRLKADRTLDEAGQELTAIGARLDALHPRLRAYDRQPQPRAFTPFPASELMVHESVHPVATTFSTATLVALGLVLLIACTSLANLQLGRLSRRRAEMAVRLALGASRWRVIRELTVEGLVLAVAGLVAGLLIAEMLMRYMTTDIEVVSGIVIDVRPRFDMAVLATAIVATALATVVAGLIPAWHIARAGLRSAIGGQSAQVASRWRGRRFVIGVQVAVSTALLLLSTVFARQAWTMLNRDLGIDYQPLAAVQFDFTTARTLDDAAVYERLLRVRDAVRARPDVQGAFIANGLPIGFPTGSALVATAVLPDDSREGAVPYVMSATAGMVPALGLRVVSGRAFTETDDEGAPRTALVSEQLAQRVFGRTDVAGRSLHIRRSRYVGRNEVTTWSVATIAGVIEDVDLGSPGQRRGAGLLVVPVRGWIDGRMVVVARMAHPTESATWLRDLARRVDRDLAVIETRTGTSLLNAETMFARVGSMVTTSLGVVALLLGLVGLAGVLGHSVSSRTREIAIRIALGAARARVHRLVLVEGLWPVVIGVVPGVLLAIGAVRLLGAALGRLGGIPVAALVAVPAALLVAGVIACLLPARRASRINPNSALRL